MYMNFHFSEIFLDFTYLLISQNMSMFNESIFIFLFIVNYIKK